MEGVRTIHWTLALLGFGIILNWLYSAILPFSFSPLPTVLMGCLFLMHDYDLTRTTNIRRSCQMPPVDTLPCFNGFLTTLNAGKWFSDAWVRCISQVKKLNPFITHGHTLSWNKYCVQYNFDALVRWYYLRELEKVMQSYHLIWKKIIAEGNRKAIMVVCLIYYSRLEQEGM